MTADEEFRARMKAFADATSVTVEEHARNWEANRPALLEALGAMTMEEFGRTVTANARRMQGREDNRHGAQDQ